MRFDEIAMQFIGLEAVLGERVTALDYAAVQRMAEQHHSSETDRLDFKREIDEDATGYDDVARRLTQDVVGMANHLGGLIFIGVDERVDGKKTQAAQYVTPIKRQYRNELVDEWVMQQAARRVTPRIDIAVEWLADPSNPDSGVVLIAVPPGDNKPYASDLGDGKFHFQRRRGTHNSEMTESEIAQAYASRGAERRDRERVMEEIIQAIDPPSTPDDGWMHAVVCVVPDRRGDLRYRYNSIAEFISWQKTMVFPDERIASNRMHFCLDSAGEYQTKRGCIVGSSARGPTVQAFQDGSLSLGWRWSNPKRTGEEPFWLEDVGVVDEATLLTQVGTALRWAAHHALRAGSFGAAQVFARLTGGRVAVTSHELRSGNWYRRQVGNQLFVPGVRAGEASTMDLHAVAGAERQAQHAAWFLLNGYFQRVINVPGCSAMEYDGRYNLDKLPPDVAAIFRTRPDPGREHVEFAYDLNDDDFATLTTGSDDQVTIDFKGQTSMYPKATVHSELTQRVKARNADLARERTLSCSDDGPDLDKR